MTNSLIRLVVVCASIAVFALPAAARVIFRATKVEVTNFPTSQNVVGNVEVTNLPEVQAVEVVNPPSTIVQLDAPLIPAGGVGAYVEVLPDGSTTPFVLPDGMVLVVTDFKCEILAGSGFIRIDVKNSVAATDRISCEFTKTQNKRVESGHINAGVVFSNEPIFSNALSAVNGRMILNGYLADEN